MSKFAPILFLVCSIASAATISISPIKTGNVRNDDGQTNAYFVGRIGGFDMRNYFAFQLPNLSATVTGATLRAFNPEDGHRPSDVVHSLSLFDLNENTVDQLINATGTALFDDLGTGTTYGAFAMAESDENTILEFVLNAAGVSAINASLGNKFAIGGTLTTITSSILIQGVFGNLGIANGPDPELVLTYEEVGRIPEPTTLALTASALLAASALRSRSSRRE